MKKTLLSLLLFSGLAAFAQLPNGSTAPDFTVTDLNGNTHTLSEYLAEGKTVILDISATWCGPCWAYKGSHKLADLYESFGGGGSNEVVVIFVEGDPSTTTEDLYGTGGNTQGNWVDGSPYAIVDSAEIADLYQITYFPTLYRICPAGTTYEFSSSLSLSSLRNNINNNCGALTGVQNHANLTADDLRFCEPTASFSAKMKNYGKNAITSATAVLKENGQVVASAPYSGNALQYQQVVVNFPSTTFNPASNYNIELSAINTVAPFNAAFASQPVSIAMANPTDQTNVEILIYTDNYASEASWTLKNSAGTVVASGGPYSVGPNADGGGGPDANTTLTETATLSLDDCYSFTLSDSYGDGWGYGNTPHGIEVKANGETIFEQAVGNFGTSLAIPAAFKTVANLGTVDNEANAFGIYPNPSSGLFTFTTLEPVRVVVSDLTGKVVFESSTIQNGDTMNLTSLQRGVYLAKVSGSKTEKVEKLVIQ
ncbi:MULTISPECIES: T9SS type A sorting domain-containing protein [unclassified Flavobacterium]|uniref:T9SS type A sorting domain-containing protein n=1 Tax=unclassified Flavobacterium TaxID=196869 RepID=UPI001F139B88|nr:MULTISPECIES: T9SS type A sorting domain-containing protein [unclassified Flavobacterium]UMY66639.1 T9SS type A sorting domain-containing protein [Flavobacterium sp. HJ-32-4]